MKMSLLVGLFFAVACSSAANGQMRASALLEHCSKSSEPDGICLGYMEAALDFITEYQLWMTLRRFEFPPNDKAICITTATSPRQAANFFINWMNTHDVGWTAANAAVGDALRDAYRCKK